MFRLLAADKRSIFVDLDDMVERIFADQAVYASPPVEASSRQPDRVMPTEVDLRAKCKDRSEYVVEKLLSHRREKGGMLYFRVNWADYEDPSSEPRDCIPEELICRYCHRLRHRETR